MKKNSIIAGLFVFCITTAGIGYTVYNSVYSDRQKHRINETAKLDSAKAPNELKDGEYTASAEGYEGPITVKVVIKEGKIFQLKCFHIMKRLNTMKWQRKFYKLL